MPEQDSWQAVPLHHIFGSDELSARAGATEMLLEQPYVGLSPSDAEKLGVRDGVLVKVHNTGLTLSLAVRILEPIALRSGGLPVGLTGMPYLPFHMPVKLNAGTST